MSRRRWPYSYDSEADADPVTAAGLLLARTRRRGSKTGETKPVGTDPSSSSPDGFDDSAYSAAYSYLHSPADDAYEEEAAYPAAEDAADTHARPPYRPAAYPPSSAVRGVATGSMVVPVVAMPPMAFPTPSSAVLGARPDDACRSRAAMRAAIRPVPPAVGETRAGMRRGGAAPPAVVAFVFVFVMGRILLVLPVVVMVVVLVSLGRLCCVGFDVLTRF